MPTRIEVAMSMSFAQIAALDLSARPTPELAHDRRAELIAWYRYQRHEFQRKLRDLAPGQLVEHAIPPVELSVMGLVRHMADMEQGYVRFGLEGGEDTVLYGEDDYAGATLETLDEDLALYFQKVEEADAAINATPSLEAIGAGSGQPLRWVLLKMTNEYAIHAGQAHMLRYAALGEVRR